MKYLLDEEEYRKLVPLEKHQETRNRLLDKIAGLESELSALKDDVRYNTCCDKGSSKDAVPVLILNRPVWLDLHNLRDKLLCKRDDCGSYKIESGEQHFTFDNAQKAAEKQGKRLLTREEFEFIAELPRRWDDKRKGMWFEFPTPDGRHTEVLFPAAGLRLNTGTLYYVGSYGCYWSSSAFSTTSGCNLLFYSTNVSPSLNSNRAVGFSVRCVKEILKC